MVSLRRLPIRKSLARKQTKRFDSKVFLTNVGAGRTVRHFRPQQVVFSKGDGAEAVPGEFDSNVLTGKQVVLNLGTVKGQSGTCPAIRC